MLFKKLDLYIKVLASAHMKIEQNNMIETYIFRFSYDHFKEKNIQELIRYI